MGMKKPSITREGNIVHIDCYDEKAAETCRKEIEKVLNNRMIGYMIRKQMRR